MTELEIFYDASCPFCRRRASWIRKKDSADAIKLSDLNENEDMLGLYGANVDDAYYTVHAVDHFGNVITGLDVVIRVLEILKCRRTLWAIKLPGISKLTPKVYDLISYYKIELGRLGL